MCRPSAGSTSGVGIVLCASGSVSGKNPAVQVYVKRLVQELSIGLGGVLAVAVATASAVEPAKAYFAGGCFWCMEEAFEQVEGVLAVTSGYMGGHKPNPTYEEVSAGGTGHAETVEVLYDPTRVSYQQLLEHFWRNVDPLTPNGQFCDYGNQYRSVIFYSNDNEKQLAEASREALVQSKRFKNPIVTEIIRASTFYPAEAYHQDFYKKHPIRYRFYKTACGRAQRLEELWGPLHAR
jgi:peptide-methionine (S)-S-oxide reductase